MKNRPGYSWGSDLPINLIRSSKGWLAVYYHPDGQGEEIIKIFNPTSHYDYSRMIDQLTLWNYGTCKLCPVVKAELDWTS